MATDRHAMGSEQGKETPNGRRVDGWTCMVRWTRTRVNLTPWCIWN